jgi:endonuclease/exonuclease/phosphatase family metal-dependent hydrolase
MESAWNMQASPLLERLDWFLASVTWMTHYPGSFVTTLSRDISDHSPCLVTINTSIPKAQIFRLKNY